MNIINIKYVSIKKYKHYGVFVQNTASNFENNGYQVDVSALKRR